MIENEYVLGVFAVNFLVDESDRMQYERWLWISLLLVSCPLEEQYTAKLGFWFVVTGGTFCLLTDTAMTPISITSKPNIIFFMC